MVKTDNYPVIGKANTIEEILCLATLVALVYSNTRNASIEDAKNFHELTGGCDNCYYKNKCLACIINE